MIVIVCVSHTIINKFVRDRERKRVLVNINKQHTHEHTCIRREEGGGFH